MKALIFQNKVVDLVDNEFPVSSEMHWMDAPEGCTTDWVLEDGAVVAPPGPSTEELMFNLRSQRDRLLAKTDYLGLSDFDMKALKERVLGLNPKINIFEVSCKTGEGVAEWAEWLKTQAKAFVGET